LVLGFHDPSAQLIRNCNVLVGVHGAGHMHIMYSADEVTTPTTATVCTHVYVFMYRAC
jgi:hypothetical protein